AADIAKTTFMTPCDMGFGMPEGNYGISRGAVAGSFRLDARELDHIAPLFGLFGNELSKVGRRARKHRAAQVGKPSLHLGISQSQVDLLIELVNNFGWRVPGRADAGLSG